jgi:hypothetical protein
VLPTRSAVETAYVARVNAWLEGEFPYRPSAVTTY